MNKLAELFHALREDRFDFFKENVNSVDVNSQNAYGMSMLHYASIYAKKQIIDELFKNNDLNVNLVDEQNWNVLHNTGFLALDEKHKELYKFYLEKNVNVHQLNDQNHYPFQVSHDVNVRKELWALTKPYWKLEQLDDYENGIRIERVNIELKEVKVDESFNKQELTFDHFTTPKTVYLFCGQGSQKVGMLSEYKNDPYANELNNIAKTILDYDILDICINGPEEKLNRTDISQLALLLASVLGFKKYNNVKPFACAGFSLGEYSALVCAGSLTFEEAIKILKVRGEAMMSASSKVQSGMLSVIGLDDDKINSICKETNVNVANFLFPKGRVLSGLTENILKAEKLANSLGALKTIKLNTSGAFHSECMKDAQEPLQQVLNEIEIKVPKCKVYSNITGKAYESVDEIKESLPKQLLLSVQWEKTVQSLMKEEIEEYYELGVGNQLKTMMRRIDENEWKKCK